MDSCEFLAASAPIAAVVVFLVLVMSSMITYFLLFRKNKRVEYPHLARVQTVRLEGEHEEVTAILANFNFDAPLTSEMVGEAIEVFNYQRTLSPADTSMLLITIVGSVTAQEFAQEWRKVGATDEVLQAYLSQMQSADVVSAPDGRTAEPETASLLVV